MGQRFLNKPQLLHREYKVARRRLRSVMQDLIYIACKVVKHAGYIWLSFGRGNPLYRIFKDLYARCWTIKQPKLDMKWRWFRTSVDDYAQKSGFSNHLKRFFREIDNTWRWIGKSAESGSEIRTKNTGKSGKNQHLNPNEKYINKNSRIQEGFYDSLPVWFFRMTGHE